MMRYGWQVWSGLALFWVGSTGSLLYGQPAQNGAAEIAKTLSDWNNRHKRFKSARYVISGTDERPDRPPDSKLPAKAPVKYVVLLDFVRGRLRMEIDTMGPNPNFERYIHSVSVCVYDGATLQQNIDREVSELDPRSPNICLTRGPLERMTISADVWPVLFAHGIVPTVNKEARMDKWPVHHTIEEFEFRGETHHEGSPCIVLRTDPVASTPYLVDEIWIDPAKESAIARYINFAGKNPWYLYDIIYQKSEHVWLPSSWTLSNIGASNLTVKGLELNPAVTDADFTLPIPSGSIVATANYPVPGKGLDPFKPAMGTFRIEADGNWTNLEKTGFTTAEGVPLPPEPPYSRWVWWISVVLIGIAFFAITGLYYRRWRRRLTNS